MGLLRSLLVGAGVIGLARSQTASTPPGPTFTGSPANCNKWYVIADGDNCDTVEAKFGITHDQFIGWNPAVSNDCKTNFWLSQAYCVGVGQSAPSTTSTTTKVTTTTAGAGGTSTPPGPTFTGSPANCNAWYVVKDGDTCDTIVDKLGITHDEFFEWNPAVSSDCKTNFWLDQAYCVGVGVPAGPTFTGSPANCNTWYTIADGDSCDTVEAKFGITHEQFLAWNPAVSDDCKTNFWLDQSYCVGLGPASGPTSTSTTSSSSSTSSTTTKPTTTTPYSTRYPVTSETVVRPSVSTDWPPSKTQAGQPGYCNNWHYVETGETCDDIIAQYGTWITADDFFAWNPSIGTDCSGLYVYYWVCVGIQPQTSLSLPYETGNATVEIPPYFTWTPTAAPTDPPVFKPTPTAGAMPSNCGAYVQAEDGDTCRTVLETYTFVTEEQFLAWNSFLDGNCDGLWAGYWYCVMAFEWDELPMPPTVTTQPSPVETGTTAECKAWYFATAPDDCAFIASIFGTFSEADFIKWNPAVGSDCAAIKSDTYYCVGVPGTPTSRTSAVAEPSPTPERPTQEGIASDCGSFWLVANADTCDSIAARSGVSVDDLVKWNPALGATACEGLEPDYYVCVGLSTGESSPTTTTTAAGTTTAPVTSESSSSSTKTTTSSSTTTSSGAEATPTPIQDGMVKGCKEFYYVQADDGCWAIANDHGIALSDFYEWNPAVNNGGECAGLWPDVYVCVGV